MKKLLLASLCLTAALAAPVTVFAQTSAIPMPTKDQMEAVIGKMGLSMGQKISLRPILESMRTDGEKVRANTSLTDTQKDTQILKIRENALSQTAKIFSADQQKKLAALLLPKA